MKQEGAEFAFLLTNRLPCPSSYYYYTFLTVTIHPPYYTKTILHSLFWMLLMLACAILLQLFSVTWLCCHFSHGSSWTSSHHSTPDSACFGICFPSYLCMEVVRSAARSLLTNDTTNLSCVKYLTSFKTEAAECQQLSSLWHISMTV